MCSHYIAELSFFNIYLLHYDIQPHDIPWLLCHNSNLGQDTPANMATVTCVATDNTSSYFESIDRVTGYIEDHLDEPISLQEITQVSGWSLWHFHRLFHAVTGETIGEYVRLRRLHKAARMLAETHRPIIEIALDGQFESQEAFTRAFKRLYGMPPGKFRRTGLCHTVFHKEPLSMDQLCHLQGGITMEPIITTIAKVTVVGMEYHGQNKNKEITAMWGVFNQKCMAIPHLTGKRAAYGVCFSDADYGTTGMFRYVAGLPVTVVDALPEGMTSCTVPAGRYAVFTHCGTLATLDRTFDYIYGTWLPSSEYRLDATRPDFEFYDERFTTGDDPASKFDIYIPIAEK